MLFGKHLARPASETHNIPADGRTTLKMYLGEIVCDSLCWRELVLDKVQGEFGNMVMNLSDP
jgi:hypothetical protein